MDTLDILDAEIFTGELLLTDLEKVKQYVERWTREIIAVEKCSEKEFKKELVELGNTELQTQHVVVYPKFNKANLEVSPRFTSLTDAKSFMGITESFLISGHNLKVNSVNRQGEIK